MEGVLELPGVIRHARTYTRAKIKPKRGELPDLSAFADLRRISVGKEAKCETGPVTLLLFLLQKSPGAGYGKDAATRFEYKEDWAHYLK